VLGTLGAVAHLGVSGLPGALARSEGWLGSEW
jgi:hypothetical protein